VDNYIIKIKIAFRQNPQYVDNFFASLWNNFSTGYSQLWISVYVPKSYPE